MSKPLNPIYLSADIEADGPIPGPFSMLSFGIAAFSLAPERPEKGIFHETFSASLDLLPDASQDPDTMKWWRETPEKLTAYERTRKEARPPSEIMSRCVSWIEELCTKHQARAIFVGYPATYDFMFLYWYLLNFAKKSPFGFQGFDVKTAAAIKLGVPFHKVGKRDMPDAWKGPEPHTHVAIDDAIEQGWMFCRMMAWSRL